MSVMYCIIGNDYHKAIQQLVNEGKIMYNKTIEGYVLICNQ